MRIDGLSVSRDLVVNMAGGPQLWAIAPSGPSGGFVPASIPFELLPPALGRYVK
jgi:hypothetical protein